MQLELVYDRANPQDLERATKLTGDLLKVYHLLCDGKAWTVQALAQRLGLPETSVSAQCRNLRKPKHGGFNVKRISLTKGLSAYMLVKSFLFLIMFVMVSCAQAPITQEQDAPQEEIETIPNRLPDYPIVAIQNEFQDLSPITNGLNYWKTETALNSKVRIGSGTCFIHDVWNYGKNCHTEDLTKVSDIFPTQIYRLNIGQIHLGDIYEVLAQYEVTNNTFITVMYADTVILSSNPDETQNFKNFKNTGIDPQVVPMNGYNCTPSLHHCVMNKIGTFMVTQEMLDHIGTSDAYVIVLFWSQNIRWKENLILDVDLHKGSLSVVKK